MAAESPRRGVVEFAMCVSILFIFMMAMIEFSRILQIQHVLREAAFEGARTAATLDATTATVQNQVNKVLSAASLVNATTTITASNPPPNTASTALAYSSTTATVSISVDPSGNSWLMEYLTAGHMVTATVTLDREILGISVP